jgi:hypothetical protein
MKKIAAFLFFLAVVLPLGNVSAAQVVIKVDQTNIVTNPGGEAIGTLKEGVGADKIEEKDGWTKVQVQGWIENANLLVMKGEKEGPKDYHEFSVRKLSGMIDTYDGKKVSFQGQFGIISKSDDRVNSYTKFTVSLVECYIPNKDFDSIKDLKEGDPVTVYGKVKRGYGSTEWYYIAVDKVIKN